VREVNWISGEAPAAAVEAMVKIRYRHERAAAIVEPFGSSVARVRFHKAQRAVTPGQAAVFYSGEQVLGGGWISGNR
jgi:tRNA-specific 2-thiouridylase